jgi:hypothetical protein
MATKTVEERLIPQIQYVAPTAGATVNVNNNGYTRLVLDPATTLATLTVTLPGSPQDGDTVEIATSQIITTLTLNGGTIISAIATLALGGFATYLYNSTAGKWFRIG